MMSVLSNIDIEFICQKLNVPLVTCCPKDKLPTKKEKGYYIVNMQNDKDEYGNDLPGSHWVAFDITEKGAFYCDSMGIIPPTVVVKYLKQFKPVPYNIQEIQYIRSTDCGWFAVAVWGNHEFEVGCHRLPTKNHLVVLIHCDYSHHRC